MVVLATMAIKNLELEDELIVIMEDVVAASLTVK